MGTWNGTGTQQRITRDRWGTPFLAPKSDGVPHFCSIFGPNLIPTWRHLGATLVQEVVLDGLVGLREAQRIEYEVTQES